MTETERASSATYAAFIGSGVVLASWAARIPQVRDGLGLTPSGLGLVLLSIAAGSIIALVLSGQLVTRYGSRRVVTAMAALMGVAMVIVALGYRIGVLPVIIGLACFGFANGAWDVAMNVQGTVVERRLRRAIMPRFHAGYSVGTVAGALLGAGAVALHVPVTAHLIAAGIVVAALVILCVRGFVADDSADLPLPVEADRPDEGPTGFRRTLATWREPRTLLIGLFVLTFAFTEGAGIDWISIAMIDGYGAQATVGTLAFAVFLAAMTVGRWFGPGLLDKWSGSWP
jgi:predicted MFS family arabinose efflux permease